MSEEILTIPIQNCKQILQNIYKIEEVVVSDVKIRRTNVFGMMGEYFKVNILGEVDNKTVELSMFGKKTPNNIQSEMAKMQGAFEKEMFMYGTLRGEFTKIANFQFTCMPTCYLTLGNYFMALEDLSELGYLNADDSHLDLEHITLTLETIAQFHAGTLLYEHKKSEELGKKFSTLETYPHMFLDPLYRNDENYLGYKWLQTTIRTIEEMFEYFNFDPSGLDKFRKRLREEGKNIFDTIQPSAKYRNVVCHGDLWLSNILFKYKNGKPIACKLIDFQALRYNPPANDILSFFYITTSSDFRERHMQKLLDLYYNKLSNLVNAGGVNLEEILPVEEFKETCQYVMPQVLIQNAGYTQELLLSYEREILSNPEKFKKFVYEDRFDFVKDGYEKNELFKTRIDESIQELYNFLVK